MKNEIHKLMLLFIAGGIIYAAMEVIYREYTHYSMFITGGLCFVLIGGLRYLPWNLPVTVRMFIGAGVITALELLCGLIVNVAFNENVWDYSGERYNFMGQICLAASSLWLFMSFIAVYLDVYIRRFWFNEPSDKMKMLP
ncbi:MAG: putative ABC transporter permease [Oscillospiraceae bacterium]|nr:putative ABC transporter permease [Oscillospiraceae bacterium]